MMDKVSLHGLEIYGYHGVLASEREQGQRFVIDVELWGDCSAAALTDDLSAALDYSRVHRVVSAIATGRRFQLLEALAGEICRGLLTDFAVQQVTVRVKKVQPPIANFTGYAVVSLTRDRAWLQTSFGDERD